MLGQNHVRAAGLKHLVAAFMTSRVSLTTLEIGLNEIDSAGALALAEALHISDNTLENLYMDNNPIGDVGASALGVCIANSSTLRVVDLSYCNLSLLGLRDVSLGLRKSTSLMGLLVEGHDWSSTKYMVRPPPNITALSKADALQYAAKCIITAMHMNPALPLCKLTGINLGYAADIERYPVTLPEPLELAASHAVCALNEAVLDCIRAQEASPDEGQTQLAQQQQQQLQEQEAAHTAYILTESRKVLAKIAALHFDADELQALCQYYCPDLICEGAEEPSTKRRRLSLELAPDNVHVTRLAIYPRVERRLLHVVRDDVTAEVKQEVLTVLRQLHYLVKSLHSVDHSVELIETLLGDDAGRS
ncbi:hypothetical protein SPRG_05877 [Saprolegnia parasitica CBS 223.65]|uniref:Uncharacterized protein n=1 Tax=Saprolegnia parasitica (strain CBS 223.65) TaxID=695850 RepID=A0A067CS42_SAPPC|nr:hypothetical protein SPRG_05877 [Saprolegnia parasitica CBS 223.65]KDO29341.1 hypothetical protein SPRG_05877 [Saprolegnia parasitica CBS 223.65]|eukprot:XP_012199844.1 hypothetical protein SPRG_05877 [Saprolegnia parasitica CBS 223.65]